MSSRRPDRFEDESPRVCRFCRGETDGTDDLCDQCIDHLRETRSGELAGLMDGPDMMPISQDSDRLAQFERDVMLRDPCGCSDPYCPCGGAKAGSARLSYVVRPWR